MDNATRNRLALFADNAQIIRKEFTWQNALTKRLAALLYAQENKPIDCESIHECYTLIKQNTGAFSSFRGNLDLCVATLLSLSSNPQVLFDETLKVYDLLKSVKFHGSDYLVVAALQIASQTNPENFTNVITRTRAYYDGMKANHFFYTGQDDYIYSAMLGLSDLDATDGTVRIEQLNNRLKDEFWNRNSVQALAQVLVLGGSDDETVRRLLSMRDALRANKIKLDKTYTLPMLGILAMMNIEINTIARDIEETQIYLREQKGFGLLSVTTQELLLFVIGIIASEYAQSVRDGILTAAISTSITNIIIAQQAAMIAAVSASASASATASSSS